MTSPPMQDESTILTFTATEPAISETELPDVLNIAGSLELEPGDVADVIDSADESVALEPGNTLATQIEAILYLKAQPLTLATLAELAGCDKKAVKEALMDLMADFAHRQTALEIAETPNGYSLQLKESFQGLVQHLVPVDLGVAALRTLATIALRGPISQTDLIDFRGSGAYDHVKELVEQGFVSKRRQANGRSFWLQVTDQFYQYFQVQGIPELKLTAKGAQRQAEAKAKADAAKAAIAAEKSEQQVELFCEEAEVEEAEATLVQEPVTAEPLTDLGEEPAESQAENSGESLLRD
jgi:segregation and condensation protein B